MGANTTRCCRLDVPTRIGWNSFGIAEEDMGVLEIVYTVCEEVALFIQSCKLRRVVFPPSLFAY